MSVNIWLIFFSYKKESVLSLKACSPRRLWNLTVVNCPEKAGLPACSPVSHSDGNHWVEFVGHISPSPLSLAKVLAYAFLKGELLTTANLQIIYSSFITTFVHLLHVIKYISLPFSLSTPPLPSRPSLLGVLVDLHLP